MIQDNLKIFDRPDKKEQLAVFLHNSLFSKKNYTERRNCKHRNSNGWCSKTRRQCPLFNFVFINH